MNKTELIDAIAKESGLKKKDAEAALGAFVNTVTGALKKGDKVQLIGFGTFAVKKRKARKGRNLKTGEPMTIKASTHPSFAAGKAFKEAVQKKK